MSSLVPFVSLFTVLRTAFKTMKIDSMHSVDHEDIEDNSEFGVDPLSDPRLDRLDLFNMVDSSERDILLNAASSDFGTLSSLEDRDFNNESSSDSGSGE